MKRSKRQILERYERMPEGGFIIDVGAPQVEDLYEFYDKTASYVRRDLDQDLVEYLIACARELRSEDFVIRLKLQRSPGEDQLARIKRSITSFFVYLTQTERNRTQNLVRRSMMLLAIGLGILSVSVWVNSMLGQNRGVVANVFAQGLTVAAWVSMWESLATFLIDWGPRRRNIKTYERLADAPLVIETSIAAAAAREDKAATP